MLTSNLLSFRTSSQHAHTVLSPTLTHFVLCTSYQCRISLRLNKGFEFNPWYQLWYLSPSCYLHLLSNHILFPSFHPYSSLCPSVCASGRAVLVCVWCMYVCVCVCVWTCVRWLTFVSLEAENHGACGFFCTTQCLGLCFFCFDTVSNPASPLVRLQECCEHSGFSFSLCVCVLCVATEDFPSCPSPTDWLSDFQLSLCYAVLAECLLSLSLSLPSHWTVWCNSPVIHLLASPSFLLQQAAVQQCLQVSVPPPHTHSVCPSILSSVHLEPAKLWRCDLCQRLPELSFLFELTPPPSSLTDSPLTGSSIHRWLVDTNTCWHSQKSCKNKKKWKMMMRKMAEVKLT